MLKHLVWTDDGNDEDNDEAKSQRILNIRSHFYRQLYTVSVLKNDLIEIRWTLLNSKLLSDLLTVKNVIRKTSNQNLIFDW